MHVVGPIGPLTLLDIANDREQDCPMDQPEWGRLLETARDRLGISQNEAARRAGISGTRWRQVVYGRASGGPGIENPVRGSAEIVARMAAAVQVTPDDLAATGREDAAEKLRALTDSATAREELSAQRGTWREVIQSLPDLTETEKLLAINAVEAWRAARATQAQGASDQDQIA